MHARRARIIKIRLVEFLRAMTKQLPRVGKLNVQRFNLNCSCIPVDIIQTRLGLAPSTQVEHANQWEGVLGPTLGAAQR